MFIVSLTVLQKLQFVHIAMLDTRKDGFKFDPILDYNVENEEHLAAEVNLH